jgi:hypothetical protein
MVRRARGYFEKQVADGLGEGKQNLDFLKQGGDARILYAQMTRWSRNCFLFSSQTKNSESFK